MTDPAPHGLLDEATGLIRRHALAFIGFALFVAIVRTVVDGALHTPGGLALRVAPASLAEPYYTFALPLIAIALCLLMAPLCAGYCRILVRWLGGESMRFTDLFFVFRNWRLCWNVALAFAAAPVGVILVRTIIDHTPVPGYFAFQNDSPIGWIFNHVPLSVDPLGWGVLILFTPLAWSGPEALLAGRPWHEALPSSLRLCFANLMLALVYLAVVIVTGAIASAILNTNGWLLAQLPHVLAIVTDGGQRLLGLVLDGVKVAFQTLALAATYRAMIRGKAA